ncbi:hypothetical protein VTK73DRAFT_8669 [Phialemonium thermophilum]|uniref:Uncharacterized protein n=1 Tax=Phialemonium thermophilum TaxID=223376 RepID=A0ABR3XN23_9PEZI
MRASSKNSKLEGPKYSVNYSRRLRISVFQPRGANTSSSVSLDTKNMLYWLMGVIVSAWICSFIADHILASSNDDEDILGEALPAKNRGGELSLGIQRQSH